MRNRAILMRFFTRSCPGHSPVIMLFFGLSCPSPYDPSARDEKMPLLNAQPTVAVRTNRRPDVALLIETSNAYARGLLRGIRAYIREHRSWSIYIGEQRRGEPAPMWLKKWRGDGIIARIESAAIAEAVLASGLPAIDVSAA